MYPSTKFQSIWRTSKFGTKFLQKNMTDKNFEKINIKFEIRIQPCTLVPNFSQFEELQFLDPNLPKNHFRLSYQNKRTLGIIYFKSKIRVVSRGVRWCQVVPRFSKCNAASKTILTLNDTTFICQVGMKCQLCVVLFFSFFCLYSYFALQYYLNQRQSPKVFRKKYYS